MNALTISLAIWGLIVAAFVVLMVYRGYLSQHETDQLYLSETVPSAGHAENDEFIRRTVSIEPICKGVGAAAILMTLVVAGVWVTQMLGTAHVI
jgi:choline-glycine betaine transporter